MTNPTADQLRMIKVSCANEVHRMLQEERDYLAEGISKGYLSDSAMDRFTMADPDGFSVRASSFAGSTDRVIVRAEDEFMIQDFVVTVTFDRPYIPHKFSIRQDMRRSKV